MLPYFDNLADLKAGPDAVFESMNVWIRDHDLAAVLNAILRMALHIFKDVLDSGDHHYEE